MFGPPSLITFIRSFRKILYNIWKVLHTDIFDGLPCIFVFLWSFFAIETQRCNQPLSWSSLIIFWLWICDSHLVQTAKLQWDVQSDVLVTTLDLSDFHNFVTKTIFHVHSCELTKCEVFLQERLPSGSIMINSCWCYNCSELHFHHNVCIIKLWTLRPYFIYLYGFLSMLFSI